MKTMRAAVYTQFGGPIRVQEVATPTVTHDAVLVKVMATGVCRSDWHGWKGHDSDIADHGLPFVPGHEFSGIVEKVGASVAKFKAGNRVVAPFILSCGRCRYCNNQSPTICLQQQQPGFTYWGSFAEYVLVQRADLNLCHIPSSKISFVQAAALGCRFTTAYRALVQQAKLKSDESLAIFGCGGVGLSCIMLAASLPDIKAKNIIAVDVNTKALALAKQLGANYTIHINTNETVESVQKKIRNVLPDGVDVAVDAAGFKATCENAVYATLPGGRMIQIGLPLSNKNSPKDDTNVPIIPMARVAGKEIHIIGSHGFDAQDLSTLLTHILQNNFDPSKLVQQHVTLSQGALILQDMDKYSPLGITMITSFSHSDKRIQSCL